jgi:hypothetical protein
MDDSGFFFRVNVKDGLRTAFVHLHKVDTFAVTEKLRQVDKIKGKTGQGHRVWRDLHAIDFPVNFEAKLFPILHGSPL